MRIRHIALLFAVTLSANAATYYVATNGNDSASGAIGAPWLTIAHGITQLSSGDTLYLRGGTFTNDWTLGGIPSGSSWSAMTTVRNYAGESPIIKPNTTNDVFGFNLTTGQYVCLSGLEVDLSATMSTGAGVKITENSNHVMLTNCVIHHVWSGHGVLMTGGTADNADDNQILNCTIHHAGWQWDGGSSDHGIYVKNRRHVIKGCDIYSNQDHGIHAFDGNPEQMRISNTRFWSNQVGIGLHSAGTISNLVFNCMSFSNNIGFFTSSGAATNKFANCVAWKNIDGFDVKEDCGPGVTIDNCIAFLNTTSDRSGSFRNLSAYPFTVRNCLGASNVINTIYSFVGGSTLTGNLVGDSYGVSLVNFGAGTSTFILASGSAAIDTGITESEFSMDYNGVSRPVGPAWDIGAFEFTGILHPSHVTNLRVGRGQGPPGISGGYFIDYVSGSDANPGTNSAAPWKHHPYMRPFSGAYTHAAGDQFFFKGGVTWPNIAFQMQITQGGSAATNDYYGTIAGFGAGRAIFDLEDKLVTNSLGQTTFQHSAAVLLDGSSSAVQYITFSGLEIKRLRIPHGAAAQGASSIDQFGRVNRITHTNLFIHDWDMDAISSGDDNGDAGGIWQNTGIVDISGCSIINCIFTQAGISQRCGVAIHGAFTVSGCTISNVSNALFNVGHWTSNVIHHVETPTDPSNHPNAMYAQFPSTISGNVLSNIATGASAIYCSPNTFYDSSNWYLVYNNLVSTDGNQEPVSYDPEAANQGGIRILNNTLVRPGGGSQSCIRLGHKPGAGNAGPVKVENNHFITAGTAISIDIPAGYSSLVNSNNVLQTPAAAAAQGYTAGNRYQPTAGGATIHAGLDLSAEDYATDMLGVPRGLLWDAGSYQKP